MKLYGKYLLMHLKCQLQYKLSFALLMLAQFLIAFFTLLGLWFMMSRFHSVDGFALPQVLIGFAVVLMAFAIAEGGARSFDMFPLLISNGRFDRMLMRPRGLIFQVLASEIDFSRLGYILNAALVLAYAIPASGIVWTPDKILTLVLMIVCGAVVFSSLFLIYASIAFFHHRGAGVHERTH